VVDPSLARHLDGAVGRAVVDHKPLDLGEPRNAAGEIGERRREALFLVEAGNLDDQLHRQFRRVQSGHLTAGP
jgi:hypothetical protein